MTARKRHRFRSFLVITAVVVVTTAAFATAGLLGATTKYGTQALAALFSTFPFALVADEKRHLWGRVWFWCAGLVLSVVGSIPTFVLMDRVRQGWLLPAWALILVESLLFAEAIQWLEQRDRRDHRHS